MIYDSNYVRTRDHDVTVGKQYQYYEDGYICNVEVVSDDSDEELIGFTLRIIDNSFHAKTYGGMGTEFKVNHSREFSHYAYNGMWRIYSPGEYIQLGNANTRAEIAELAAHGLFKS
jgi:hypothetical protein